MSANNKPPRVISPWIFRPGFTPVRRDAGHWQVGYRPGRREVFEDTAAVRTLFEALGQAERGWAERSDTSASINAVVHRLRRAELIVPRPTMPHIALAGLHGSQWPDRVTRRLEAVVHVVGPDFLADPLAEFITGEGLTVERNTDSATEPPWLTVIASEGPLPRDRLDHELGAVLLVSTEVWEQSVGPLIVPGRTACLRCLDASADDPRLPLILEQLSQAPKRAHSAGTLATYLALALAAREAVAFVDGDLPSTWSATITLGPTGAARRTQWARHPHCSCTWDQLDLGLTPTPLSA